MEEQISFNLKDTKEQREWDRFLATFSSEQMILGSVTTKLKEVLHRAPDTLLDIIWEDAATGQEQMDRAQKEEILYQKIPKIMEEELIYEKMDDIEILNKVAAGQSLDLSEAVTVERKFIPRGWIFCFEEEGHYSLAVPEEFWSILKVMEEPETKRTIGFIFGVRCAVEGCLELYGVCSKAQVETVFERSVLQRKSQNDGEESKKLSAYLEECLKFFEKQGLFWRDGDFIISHSFETEKEYMALLRRQRGKDYYIPDYDMVKSLLKESVYKETPGFEAVHRRLTQEIKDLEMAEAILEELAYYVKIEDWGIVEIMDSLCEWDIFFDDDKTATRMTAALSEWIYHLPRWSECGYSRKQRNKENDQLQYVLSSGFGKKKPASKKTYPNDPCPCGSGKKYKKCCGRQ